MDQVVADVRQVVDAELVTRGTSRRYGARSGGYSRASLKLPL
jgi:lambda repressor-like predicted transcriptional regulator